MIWLFQIHKEPDLSLVDCDYHTLRAQDHLTTWKWPRGSWRWGGVAPCYWTTRLMRCGATALRRPPRGASTCININIATCHLLASQEDAWDTFGEEFGQTGRCPHPVQTHNVSLLPAAPFSAPHLHQSERPLPYLLFVGQTWSKLSKRTHPGCFPKLILFLKLKEEDECGEVGVRFLPSVASLEELTVSHFI